VAAHDGGLQPLGLGRLYADVGQVSDPGRDAVDRGPRGDRVLDDVPGRLHGGRDAVCDLYRFVLDRDREDVFQG
jgi:hypothetical protein